MTGYGRAVETVNGREFTVEIRSVNNRYLDCTVKLPRSFSFAEEAVKAAVKAAVSRGKVDVYISVRSETEADVQVTLNKPVLEGYLAAMRQMVADYGVHDDISVSTLSRMSDIFVVDKPKADEDQLKADLLGCHFMDANGCEFNQIDFMHLTRQGHAQLAERFAALVPQIIK